MKIQTSIEQKLHAHLAIQSLLITNESHMHGGSTHPESHFKIHIVSNDFLSKPLMARHRLVQQILADEISQIRAIHLVTQTETEWQKSIVEGAVLISPPCHNQ